MRIGFVSFEYAGTGAGGGIGTYVRQAAKMMALRGHDVEVFCGSDTESALFEVCGARVNQIACSRHTFAEEVRATFTQRHRSSPFDLIEGAEFGADAIHIHGDHPEVALVVRLHTSTSLITQINNSFIPLSAKLRFIFGALRRAELPKLWWDAEDEFDAEKRHTLSADLITAPSKAIAQKVSSQWGLPRDRVQTYPNVFEPSQDLLEIPIGSDGRTALFLGKLEVRKGVLDLAKAVPIVGEAVSDAKFLLVGRDLPYPGSQQSVGEIMHKHYGRYVGHTEHLDAVAHAMIPNLLSRAAVAVFPSIWENFPYVCLEAMAAGRAVIGSSSGGMAEIIEDGETGLLVSPQDPKALADAIVRLMKDPALGIKMGIAAREHVASHYNADRIGPLQEQSYQAAVHNARKRNLQ